MHLYWRIQHDLNCMGEFLVFHDPRFCRALRQWVTRNSAGIALAEGLTVAETHQVNLN